MTEIEQKAVEEMADRTGEFYNYQITQSDAYELAEFLYIAGYRHEAVVREEAVKEFAEKAINHITGTINGYAEFLKAEEEFNGIDTNTYTTMKSNIEVYQRLINTIRNLAEQYGKEE